MTTVRLTSTGIEIVDSGIRVLDYKFRDSAGDLILQIGRERQIPTPKIPRLAHQTINQPHDDMSPPIEMLPNAEMSPNGEVKKRQRKPSPYVHGKLPAKNFEPGYLEVCGDGGTMKSLMRRFPKSSEAALQMQIREYRKRCEAAGIESKELKARRRKKA